MEIADDHILKMFIETALKQKDKPAIIHRHERISYIELLHNAKKRAAQLSSQNINPGDSVIVYIPMSIELYESLIALLWIGAIPVFIDSWADQSRISHCITECDIVGAISIPKLKILKPFISGLKPIPKWFSHKKSKVGINHPPIGAPDDSAIITFTTGSTGKPKGAIRSQAFLKTQFKALSDVIPAAPESTTLVSLPIVLLMNLVAGSTSVIFESSSRWKNLLRPTLKGIISRHSVSRIIASPALLTEMAHTGKHTAIQEIFTGGGPVFPNEAQAYIASFPNATHTIIYGSTEAEPVSHISAHELLEHSKQGICVGHLSESLEAQIIPFSYKEGYGQTILKHDFENLYLTDHQPGEIIIAGPQVLDTYTNQDYLLKTKLNVEGKLWHILGDAGFRDRDGRLHLLGRSSERIETKNGVVIFPFTFKMKSQEIEHLKDVAALNLKSEFLIAAVADTVHHQYVLERLTELWPDVKKVHFVKAIPKDSRHQTKVDMDGLKKLIERLQ